MRFLLLLSFSFTLLFAIIDIATIDFQQRPEGFSGSVFGSFQKKRGNTHKEESEYGARVQYDSEKTVSWIQAKTERDKASGVLTDDNAFVHLRHIHQLYSQEWAVEYYAQLKQDKFKALERRALWGVGLRYRILDSSDYGKLFFGTSVLEEHVDYTPEEPDPDEHNYRMSNYLSYKLSVNEVFDLGYLGYYQPKLDKASDYVTASIMEMTIHLTKVFDLSYLLEFDYDTRPPLGVHKRDLVQKLSFVYRFGKDDPVSAYAHYFLQSLDELEEDEAQEAIAVEIETEIQTVKDSKDVFAGEWRSGGEHFSISLDGTGAYVNEEGIYREKLRWKVIATETQEGAFGAKNQSTKLVIIRFLDEEGRDGRVENYLWNDNVLVGLSESCVRTFRR